MTLYPNSQTVWKTLQSQKQEQLYQVMFTSIKEQVARYQYAELASKFKQSITRVPKDINWLSFKTSFWL